jgi:thiamine biosynthesis lipoprotein
MGSEFNFWIDRRAGAAAGAAVSSGQILLRRIDRELTRFNPSSDLCLLNNDPREEVPVSSLTARFVETAIWAARASEGLVDSTVIRDLERLGYEHSLTGHQPANLAEAVEAAPRRRPAAPNPLAHWLEVSLDREQMVVTRPQGLRLDSGGVGKGMAADMLAAIWQRLIPRGTPWIIDCGGDLRLGELADGEVDYSIAVEGPAEGDETHHLNVRGGAVATSGIGRRIWRRADGTFAHHLLDPSTGRPAWTGLVAVTAVAETAVIAETLTKTALLSGPQTAADLVGDRGGLVFHDNGVVEQFAARRGVAAGAPVRELELAA